LYRDPKRRTQFISHTRTLLSLGDIIGAGLPALSKVGQAISRYRLHRVVNSGTRRNSRYPQRGEERRGREVDAKVSPRFLPFADPANVCNVSFGRARRVLSISERARAHARDQPPLEAMHFKIAILFFPFFPTSSHQRTARITLRSRVVERHGAEN